jgi:hypothetical protein
MSSAALGTAVAARRPRSSSWVHDSTPARLRLASTVLATLIVLLAVLGSLSATSRATATSRSSSVTEPILIDAQTAFTSLSDADTTAAGGLLAGPVAPVALQSRYQQDIATTSAAVADASQRANDDAVLARALRKLAVGVPFYTAVVQQAATNNRLGYPVAAAYQGEASSFLRSSLLPAARDAYAAELTALNSEQASATTRWPTALALVLLAITLIALILLQVWMRRRFHRSINVALLTATVLLLVVGGWTAVALVRQTHSAKLAATYGSAPLAAYTDARLLALQARADDELALVSRDSVPAYQKDFTAVWSQLSARLASQRDELAQADAAVLLARHVTIRRLAGQQLYGEASAVASGAGSIDLPAAATSLDRDLTAGVTAAQRRFDSATADARRSLAGLAPGGLALCLVALILILLGVRERAKEYR